MKKLTIIFSAITLLISISAHAQIALENTYNEFILTTTLESAGTKYATYDIANFELKLYNLNHTVYKTITITNPTANLYDVSAYPNPEGFSLNYITEGLFDTDSEVEFMLYYTAYDASYTNYVEATAIINEDGTVLFKRDNVNPRYMDDEGIYAVINASDNTTKMFLVEWDSGTSTDYTHVYNLPGTYLCDPCGGNGTIMKDVASTKFKMQNYPNPANDYTIINYELPENTKEGTIIISNINGEEIKSYKVGKTFNHIRISTNELPSGTYFYTIRTEAGQIQSKKMIVVK